VGINHGHIPNHLISVANFEKTNKAELVHIAHYNAHILKQFKNPIRQYHNQYSIMPQKSMVVSSGLAAQASNLSPNILPYQNNFIKPSQHHGNALPKHESSQLNYITGGHGSTPKISSAMKMSTQIGKPAHVR
jgi:hypothetical protein